MKLTFQIDSEYDKKMIPIMLSRGDWEDRAKRMGLGRPLATKIHELCKLGKFAEAEKELDEIVNSTYKKIKPYISKTKDMYQESWNEIIDDFSKTVAELTVPWFFDEYFVVVTNFNMGLRDPKGDKIGRWWKENPYTQRRLTAYELIQAHFVEIHRRLYKESGLDNSQIWALAEIASNALTGLEDGLKKHWIWDNKGYYTDHNYPQLVELQKQLLDPYLNKKSFAEYVEKGIELVKQFPSLAP